MLRTVLNSFEFSEEPPFNVTLTKVRAVSGILLTSAVWDLCTAQTLQRNLEAMILAAAEEEARKAAEEGLLDETFPPEDREDIISPRS